MDVNKDNKDVREELKEEKESKINEKEENARDGAGPSNSVPLPGSINTPRTLGVSKSEHSFCRITTRDLNNALKSISFGAAPPTVKINFQELKIPILNKEEMPIKNDSTTLVDLKRFMASCFKVSKDFREISNVHITAVENVTSNVENVIVTGTETKLSKVGEKKKTSETISRSDLGLFQKSSLTSIGSNVCRICMTRGRERLISPCNCKGSLANVHLSCLERWLNQVGRNHCELCGYSYPAIRTPRYTVLQALRLWFGNPRNRSHLQSDCLIFWLLSTVTAGLLAVCIVGTQYFVMEGNKFGKHDAAIRKPEGISHRITETAMDFFMAIVLCGYSITVYLLWKDHYVMWNRWRRANVNVRLLLSSEARPTVITPPRYIV